MQLLDRPIYLVGDFEVDPRRFCLRRENEEYPLRQKSFQVLLYLIEHRGRLVTKEELIQNIWGGAAITDDALVQIIVELRKLFGDDSRQPRFIRTIPKAGYQLIALVSEIRPDSSNETKTDLVEIEEVTTVEVEYEQSIETEARRWSDAAIRWLLPRFPASLYPSVTMFAALGLIATLAAAGYLVRRADDHALNEVTVPHIPGKKPVAVMYFENRSGDSELDWLREGLADMLIASLSRSQRLTLLSRQQLTALLGHTGRQSIGQIKLEDGLEIARRSQTEMMILGGFARLGSTVRIDVTLHDARTGQLQAAESLIADSPEQILTQIDLLALKLTTHLGATMADADAQRGLATVMTSNLDAYRYYSLALEQTQMFQFHEAIALLEKALALDPQFAMAYARIGYVYAVRMGQGERARPYLNKALTLAERLSEKDRLFITAWQANAVHDAARAIEVYRELTTRYPMETEAYQRLSWLLQTQNRNEEALTITRQGLLTDPEWKDLHNALGTVCMRLGRNEEALSAFQRYIQLAPNDPNAWDSLGLFHQWMGQYDEAEAAYNHALALNPESGVAIIHLGNLRFQQGRYRAAAEQFRRFSQIARDDNGRARGVDRLAWVHLKKGDLDVAAATVKEEIRYNPASVWNSFTLALARRDQAAVVKLSGTVFAPSVYNFLNERGFLRVWNYQIGYAALRRGRAEEAINHFREALRHRPLEWNIDSFEDCLANAYLELGRWDEAIAEYERILGINPNYPLAQFHLGQSYERKGDLEKSRAAYLRFLQIWKNADADVPELVEAKRRLQMR